MSITKTGVWTSDNEKYTYLVNNFSETKTTTDWTLDGTINSNGVAVLTGTGPRIISKNFPVGDNDIVVVEFNVAVPTPSTSTGGSGIYLGTTYGTSCNYWSYNTTTNQWNTTAGISNNVYYLNSYNLTTSRHVKGYIIGQNVDITTVPPPIGVSGTGAMCYTTLNEVGIRSGYNSNTSMVIHIWDFKIYKLNTHSISELNTDKASLYKGGINAPRFYEI